MNYCDNCGHNLEAIKENEEWYCAVCKRHLYANPVPTIDAMLIDEDGRMLLGRRSIEPNKEKLNLPGGFVDSNETFEEAIARELKEELGLDSKDYGSLQYVTSRVDHHTQEGKHRQLLCVLMTASIKHKEMPLSDEVSEYVWKAADELKPDDLTNEKEYKHIQDAIKKLRY